MNKIFVITIAISVFLMFASLHFPYYNKIADIICNISVSYFIIAMIFAIFGTIYVEKYMDWEKTTIINSNQIIALDNTNLIKGHTFLGRGYINEEIYYIYFKKLKNESFELEKVNANNAILCYDDSNYRIDTYEKYKHWLFFFDKDIYYKIYIPKGSIIQDFTIAL